MSKTPEEINAINAAFWEKRSADFEAAINDQSPAGKSARRLALGALQDQEWNQLSKEQKPLEQLLEESIPAMRDAVNANAAKMPRPKNKPTIRSEFLREMKSARNRGEQLDDFIDAVKAGSIEGLELTDHPNLPGQYLVSADAVEAYGVKKSHETLKDWWKAAGKGELAG